MFIYEIRNKINGKKLIGQTIQKYASSRWQAHKLKLRRGKHENRHLQRAWNKYGEKNFDFVVVCKVQTQKELNKEEIHRIVENKNGYNILPGGENGPLPEITKKRISLTKRGKPQPWNSHKKPWLGELNKKRVWTEEARRKVGERNKLRKGTKSPAQSKVMKDKPRNEFGRWI